MCESVSWRTCAANVFIFVLIFLWVCACVFTCIGLDKLFSSPPQSPLTVWQADSWAVPCPIVWGLSSNPARTTSYTARVFVYWCVGEVALLCPCTNTSNSSRVWFFCFCVNKWDCFVCFFSEHLLCAWSYVHRWVSVWCVALHQHEGKKKRTDQPLLDRLIVCWWCSTVLFCPLYCYLTCH